MFVFTCVCVRMCDRSFCEKYIENKIAYIKSYYMEYIQLLFFYENENMYYIHPRFRILSTSLPCASLWIFYVIKLLRFEHTDTSDVPSHISLLCGPSIDCNSSFIRIHNSSVDSILSFNSVNFTSENLSRDVCTLYIWKGKIPKKYVRLKIKIVLLFIRLFPL